MYTLVYSIQEAYTENQELARVDLSATLDPFESNQFMLCSQAMSFLSKVVPCPIPSWFTLACLINPSTPKFNLKCCLFPWGLPWLYRPHFCLFSELLLHFSSVPSKFAFLASRCFKNVSSFDLPCQKASVFKAEIMHLFCLPPWSHLANTCQKPLKSSEIKSEASMARTISW